MKETRFLIKRVSFNFITTRKTTVIRLGLGGSKTFTRLYEPQFKKTVFITESASSRDIKAVFYDILMMKPLLSPLLKPVNTLNC